MDTQAVIYCHELVPQTCACATLVPRRHDRTSPNDRAARALILPLPCSRRTICCITSLRSSLRTNKDHTDYLERARHNLGVLLALCMTAVLTLSYVEAFIDDTTRPGTILL